MKKTLLILAGLIACFLCFGCQGEPASDDYGGEVKDSGGTPVPPGKSGGAAVPADR